MTPILILRSIYSGHKKKIVCTCTTSWKFFAWLTSNFINWFSLRSRCWGQKGKGQTGQSKILSAQYVDLLPNLLLLKSNWSPLVFKSTRSGIVCLLSILRGTWYNGCPWLVGNLYQSFSLQTLILNLKLILFTLPHRSI